MKTIRKNSKRGQYYIYLYQKAEAQSVEEFYKKPSSRKVQADYECQQQCYAEHGLHYRIISGNSFNFTAAWHTSEGLRVETSCESYIVK